MKLGENSPEVKQLQTNLNKVLGTSTPITSIFSSATEVSIRAFQQLNGLPVTGNADDATVKALNAKAGITTPAVDKKAQAIVLLTQALNLLKEAN
ncbi:peptidoglycan-binding domain-containing protein [Sporolactobacillus sp. CQH2019]|uniref:peptidoglycan-binding domain-containing protein n=1 Tax=Sporolactobacillus sp. CQH2019 TaxID=3023512 RepID=UPI002368EF28|nr:peptidoglycan-binding domain-containing protein [Sporolactobacillus sp. CQH2019]MDD9147813.1 peptidoglycan-binding domain-containing protein [Sporolactobacillus sp. CQH2019]